MGKKKKTNVKGKGAEKTALKTEKKAEKRVKKSLAEKGEEDVESLIAEFVEKDKCLSTVSEKPVPPPSPRSSMTFTAHPEHDDIYLFGGEYFNGQRTFMYNELYRYHVKKNEWHRIFAPNAPPPRCSHQTVCIPQGGGQLWMFGGEFASPTQSQFYHYKDLWMLPIATKRWEKISAPGGPSSRSGHRMVNVKRDLIVFGGFHDKIRDYKYYNDAYAFSLDTRQWLKLTPEGLPPAPRSACQLAVNGKGQVLVFGGYSKRPVKRGADDEGTIHTDMFTLVSDCKRSGAAGDVGGGGAWRWQVVKQSGARPSPRCSMSMCAWSAGAGGSRAIMFGGVNDDSSPGGATDSDSEEDSGGSSSFYNDLHLLDTAQGKWFTLQLHGSSSTPGGQQERRPRRRKAPRTTTDGDATELAHKEESDSSCSGDDDDGDDTGATAAGVETLELQNASSSHLPVETAAAAAVDDSVEDVFKVVVSVPSAARCDNTTTGQASASTLHNPDPSPHINKPCPRMNACVAIRSNQLFLYGGLLEHGDKQFTLNDMYVLDLHKLDEWRTLIQLDPAILHDWQGSSSSSEESEEEDDEDGLDHGNSENEPQMESTSAPSNSTKHVDEVNMDVS